MKKIFIVLLLVFSALPVLSADISANFVVDYGKFTTFKDTLNTSHRKDSVYVTFPIHDRNIFYMSKVLPTGALLNTSRKVFDITGDVVLHSRYTTASGASNSVVLWTKYLTWAADSSRFEVARFDSTFLDLDSPGSYTSTAADSLDYVTGKLYITPLSSHLKPVAGYVIYYSTDDSAADFYLEFWQSITRHVTPAQP